MDGSNSIFIVMPIVMMLALGVLVILPWRASSRQERAAAALHRRQLAGVAQGSAPQASSAGPQRRAPVTQAGAASPAGPAATGSVEPPVTGGAAQENATD
jgi:hypothetical protein